MRKRAQGLEWIKTNNQAQVDWAGDYLKNKGKLQARHLALGPITHRELLTEGLELEKTAEGVHILQAMRAAWRQREYRQPEKGRKPYTFILPIETKQLLSNQAKACDHNETEHLVALIRDGHQEAIKSSKWMREQQAKARKDLPKTQAAVAFQRLRTQELEKHLKQCLKDRFTAENVASDELERKVEREMDRIAQEIRLTMDEHRSTNPRLRDLGI